MILIMGISPIRKTITGRVENLRKRSDRLRFFHSHRLGYGMLFELMIDRISGFACAGGGMVMFFILVFILRYGTHVAVGTSG